MYEVWYHDWKEDFFEEAFDSYEEAEAWIEELEAHEMWDYSEAWYGIKCPEDDE